MLPSSTSRNCSCDGSRLSDGASRCGLALPTDVGSFVSSIFCESDRGVKQANPLRRSHRHHTRGLLRLGRPQPRLVRPYEPLVLQPCPQATLHRRGRWPPWIAWSATASMARSRRCCRWADSSVGGMMGPTAAAPAELSRPHQRRPDGRAGGAARAPSSAGPAALTLRWAARLTAPGSVPAAAPLTGDGPAPLNWRKCPDVSLWGGAKVV